MFGLPPGMGELLFLKKAWSGPANKSPDSVPDPTPMIPHVFNSTDHIIWACMALAVIIFCVALWWTTRQERFML